MVSMPETVAPVKGKKSILPVKFTGCMARKKSLTRATKFAILEVTRLRRLQWLAQDLHTGKS